jgi:polar amino acid transport system substrate-binding protein
MRSLSAVIIAGGVLLSASLAFGSEKPRASVRPLLVVLEDYPPYEYVEEGVPKGIDVDVMKRVFARLGISYEFKFYPFSRGWLMLTRGTADAAPSISYKREREPHLYYTDQQRAFASTGRTPPDYLWLTEYVFFINKKFKGSLRFENYEQIRKDGLSIGTLKAYTYHPGFLEEPFNFKRYVNPIDGFRALAAGEIDLFPMAKTVGLHILGKSELMGQITYLPKVMFSKPYLMVFSKASDYPNLEEVMERFNAEIRKMRTSGEFDEILHSYLPSERHPHPPRPLLFVCEEWAPFEYMDGDTLKGIDVDITARIMQTLGIPYEIRIYPWSRAWMMAENGKADAVLSVSYKASREDVLHYTEDQRAFAETGALPRHYLWMSEYVFFVKKKFADTYTFTSYNQLKEEGYRVGKNRGYSYTPDFTEALLPGPVFNDTQSGLEALVAEKIDLYPMDKTVALATLKKMGLLESVTFLPRPLFSKPYLAPFVRKSNYPNIHVVMERFYDELLRLRNNKEIDRIRQKHLGDTE